MGTCGLYRGRNWTFNMVRRENEKTQKYYNVGTVLTVNRTIVKTEVTLIQSHEI